jgi:hypothetical protein
MKAARVAPELQPLHDAALGLLAASAHPWAPRLSRVLRRCRLRLQDGGGGYTIPLHWLGVDVIWLGRDLAARGVTYRGLHTLLHETAHQCGAVLPEWKNWFRRWGGRYRQAEIYGDAVNSADAIASAVLRSAGWEPAEKSPGESS